MSFKVKSLICALSLIFIGGGRELAAISTFSARFASSGIAGPNLTQTAILYMHYFPGDGEALLRTAIKYEHRDLTLGTVRSTLGKVRSVEPLLEVDYGENPLGRESIDTLFIDLKASGVDSETRWEGMIFSSLGASGEVAHSSAFGLEVGHPIQLDVSIEPARVYPGEQVDIELVIHNVDPQRRSVDKLIWEWPEGLSILEGEPEVAWQKPLQAGQRDTLHWQAHIEREKPGELVIGGRAESAQIAGSPLPETRLRVAPVPLGRVETDTDFLRVGELERLVFFWSNAGLEDIEIDELRLDVPQGFAHLKLVEKRAGVSIESPGGEKKGKILIKDVGRFEPGQELKLELEVRPLKTGPFPWKSWFKPAGHFWHIPLGGRTLVRVVQEHKNQHADLDKLNYFTDLQLLSKALSTALERELDGLVVRRGLKISLQPDGKEKGNWIVEDVLTRALMARGYQISLNAHSPDEADFGVMYYRMVDSRIVYTPQKKGWARFGAPRLREAFGDLFLRLEIGGKVEWARQVLAYGKDEVPGDKIDLLGGSDMVDRTVIESEYKLVERGLSGSILGGLLYIFFVP